MTIYILTFASKSFIKSRNLQTNFIKKNFQDKIKLINLSPSDLDREFFAVNKKASEKNKYGYFSFKPYIIMKYLKKIEKNDLLIYLDVNDRLKPEALDYIEDKFSHKNFNILVTLTNYLNIFHISKFACKNYDLKSIIYSFFRCQSENGLMVFKKNQMTLKIVSDWLEKTIFLSQQLMNSNSNHKRTRHDQETFFYISNKYKSHIGTESWFLWKIFGIGLRKFIDWEFYRL